MLMLCVMLSPRIAVRWYGQMNLHYGCHQYGDREDLFLTIGYFTSHKFLSTCRADWLRNGLDSLSSSSSVEVVGQTFPGCSREIA